MPNNMTALITGGTRGIGKAIVYTLAQKGYNIAFVYNKSTKEAHEIEQSIQKMGVKCTSYALDLSETVQIHDLVSKIIKDFGKIDVLVNNAGVCFDKELCDRTVSLFEKTLKVNVLAAFELTKLVGQHMKNNKYGKVVNISSDNAISSFYPTTIDYDCSKAALNVMTKDFAIELAPYVNVNAIAPGWVDTDMNKNILTDDIKELESKRILKGRIGTPQDIANLVSFLVSAEAEYINGEVIVINGGMF